MDLGNVRKALADYEEICQRFASSTEFVLAAQAELELGIGLAKQLVKDPDFRDRKKSFEGAEELLIRAAERLAGTADADKAVFELARLYQREGEQDLARSASRIEPECSRQYAVI